MSFSIASLHSQVEKVGECWNWNGKVSKHGPVMSFDGKSRLVTHLICERRKDFEAGHTVAHKCCNTMCVNPAHLFSCTRGKKQTFTDLLQLVRTKAEEVGNCWDWSGALQQHKFSPMFRYKGKVQPVRRILAMSMQMDMQIDEKPAFATVKCGNRLCVNPTHVVTLSRKELQQRTAEATPLNLNQARCRKLAQSARRNGKLTEAQVAEIRAIEGMKQRDIAALYGITQATVSAIRRGVKWKDYSNPYLQLMGGKR